jgi:type IV pilus assembly protein PilV
MKINIKTCAAAMRSARAGAGMRWSARQPASNAASNAASSQAGFTLIEVLVVLLLFSVGLLGLVGLQAKAMQISTGGEDSTRAAMLANEMASAMWVANSVTNGAATVTAWNTRVADTAAGGLPNGVGTVTLANCVATITVTWHAPQEPASARHQYVSQVTIPKPTPPVPLVPALPC